MLWIPDVADGLRSTLTQSALFQGQPHSQGIYRSRAGLIKNRTPTPNAPNPGYCSAKRQTQAAAHAGRTSGLLTLTVKLLR